VNQRGPFFKQKINSGRPLPEFQYTTITTVGYGDLTAGCEPGATNDEHASSVLLNAEGVYILMVKGFKKGGGPRIY
jgi:hypothetical protein